MSLNTPHKIPLTEGQISTILFVLEGYNPLDSNGYDPDCREDIDSISEILESSVDKYYDKVEKAQAKQPTEEW